MIIKSQISGIKLVIFFVVIICILSYVGLHFYNAQRYEIKEKRYAEISVIATLKASQIIDYRNERLADATVFSENEFYSRAVKKWIANPNYTELQNRIVYYFQQLIEEYQFKGVLMFDTLANVRLAAGIQLPSIGKETYSFFRESMHKKATTISDIYYCNKCADIHLDIFAPIFVEEKVIGGMIFRIDPEEFLYPLIQSWPTQSKSSESLLISEAGNEVVFINKLRHKDNTVLKLRFQIDSSNINIPAVAAIYGIEGLMEGIDYRGVPVLSDIRKIPDSPWWMIVKVDLQELYAGSKEKAIYIALLIGLLILLFAMGFFWLWTSQKKTLRLIESENNLELQAREFVEQKRSEEALRIKNWVFDASLAANSVADINGIMTEVNESFLRIWDYASKKEVIGMRLDSFVENKKDLAKIILALNKTGKWEGNFIAKKKDSTLFTAQSMATTVKDENGDIIGYQSAVIDVTQRKLLEDEIKKRNEELDQRVKERTLEIELSKKELHDSQEALLNIVDDLNEKTQQLALTAELLTYTNKELESFSYSVSHDLRAPLRAVDGFAKILLEDYSSALDSEGKRYLNVIVDNANQMGQLIDDLLTFSRLNRYEIKFTEINMFDLAKSIFEESVELAKISNVEFILETIPDALGDLSMVKQIWRNLIGNAIKYGRRNEKLILEIGNKTIDEENAYYVKDNGVGFDMAYKDKLFGVFQRLHSSKEFEGTGVGLAIVQRIVHRLGGKVWAEGEVNKGATFYFTLQKIKHN